VWGRLERRKVSNQEEKGKEHKAEFRERIELTDKLDLALGRAVQDTSGSAVEVAEVYGDALQPAQLRRLQEIAQAPATITELPQEKAWEMLVGYNREIRDIQLERWEAEKARERKEDLRYWLLLGLTIVIALVGWFRQWLLDIVERLLGG